jgi:acetoin:2,6-dichlorophenolindophenol oxidoreductase subunit beta
MTEATNGSSATAADRATLTMRWAITHALDEEMARDETVHLIGQDVGRAGGVFGLTRGLFDRYGPTRVWDAPISEEGLANLVVGAAMTGLRPVLEIMFMDITALTVDALANHAAKIRYLSGGELSAPLVIRTLAGTGFRMGSHHSQSLEAWFAHVPGLKVVHPSSPADAKGLLKASIRDDDPVVFVESKALLSVKGPAPAADEVIPLGTAEVKRPGRDVTVVATGRMVRLALEAAGVLAGEGIEVEVVDPRTLLPLDVETILDSVANTGNLIVAHDAPRHSGIGAEIVAAVAEAGLFHLDSPVRRVTGAFTPIPPGSAEDFVVPTVEQLVAEIRAQLAA